MGLIADNPAPETSAGEPTVEERRALIERVAGSEQFSRSARLRDFLLYVGRKSLTENCPEIHEQEIGAKVFGRPDSYDRSSDNIVRVNATELRKRIESYFETAGANEPLIFEIPRGSYRPVFRPRVPVTTDSAVLGHEASPNGVLAEGESTTGVRGRSSLIAHSLWAGLCLILVVACVVLMQQNRTMREELNPWANKPAVSAFWTGFLGPHLQTDIVLPDDSASLIQDIDHTSFPLGDYLNRNYLWRIQSSDMSADRKQDLSEISGHNLVTFGGVLAAQKILSEIPVSYSRYVTLARLYTADEVKRNNVVLVGGKKSVPWDHLFDDKLNFVTDYDYQNSQQLVRNRNPKPGEQDSYFVSYAPNSLVAYSAIAYLPNPSGTGNAIILAGTDSDATEAAAEFLTSEEQMSRFRSTLKTDRFPYFEVLLKTSRLSGTSLSAELIAYRTYPSLH